MSENTEELTTPTEEKCTKETLKNQDEMDENAISRMTASYSEISFHSDQVQPDTQGKTAGPSRPYDLPSENHDLEFKIKLSSPVAKKGETPVFGSSSASRSSTPSGKLYRQILAPQIGQIDITVLHDLEHEAQKIAQSVDNLIENLSSILHSNSSLTAENMDVYKDAVGKTCDAMDNNIKSMYTILAKGEEVSQAMIPVQAQAARIAEIKRLLQLFENNF
ncbi:BLOC-1-related complex subunit 6 isoform X2 [Bombyx mandarina]|uniref:BLOC-1-related complex subunit 6 isoform X2 n=1 Tax=Bombyx mandarina TaxID=7092 RepID=A0A6J2JI71_BOMMA|nr:BLOC-1-related complex subunit 6 isoform X2 [Bombyx mandarina]